MNIQNNLVRRLLGEALVVVGSGVAVGLGSWMAGMTVEISTIIGLSALGIVAFLTHLGGIVAVKPPSTPHGTAGSLGLIDDNVKWGDGWRSSVKKK